METERINNYQHISIAVDKTNDKLRRIISGELKPLVTSSLKEQDKIGGYYPGDQLVIAGRTGTGKTAKLIRDISDFSDTDLNPHYKDKIIILYDSWEMPDWRNILRMYSNKSESTVKELIDYKNRLDEEKFERIKAIGKEFKKYPIYFNNSSMSPSKWEANKYDIQKQYPNHTLINVLDHARLATKETEKSEEALITNLMMAGMRAKNNIECVNIYLSQMNRNIETASIRQEMGRQLPVSSDLFGSDAIFQCADIVIALHRPGMYKLEEWDEIPTGYDPMNPDRYDSLLLECILKQRDGWTGTLTMRHNLGINQIKDL